MTDLWFEVTGSGPPVALLHEGFLDSRMWERQLALADRFTLIRYDLRGYGRSPRFEGPYSPVEDLRNVLDAAHADGAALVGASRGGKIALDFVLTHPDRVTALVLVCSGLGGHSFEVGTAELEARWEEAERAGDAAAMAEIDLELWVPLGDEGGLREMAHDNAHLNLEEDPAVEIDSPAKERLGEISVPTLVITDDRDQPGMTEIGDLLERGIRGARREVLAGDHVPNIRSPDAFNRLVADFLGTHVVSEV